jgi:uncharacterized SAM-binding protein YcdF (DUF218 family)
VALAVALVLVIITATRVVMVGRDDERRASDAIVVLGAAQFDGEPGPFLTARLEHAKVLYDDGVAPRIITTGGALEGDRFTEAEAGVAWLADHGVPEDDVVAVRSGSDTLSTMTDVAPVMKDAGWTSAVVVTDPAHILRSVSMLGDQGIDAFGSPATDSPDADDVWAQVKYVGRETFGNLFYQWQRMVG